jgi:hypothetical protein
MALLGQGAAKKDEGATDRIATVSSPLERSAQFQALAHERGGTLGLPLRASDGASASEID